jgi:hypothetical protein
MNKDEFFKSEAKVFTKKSIGLATLFGGPIVTGYMISENFIAFGEREKGKQSLINGAIGTALFLSALMAIPEKYMALLPNSVANSIFPALYTFVGVWWMEKVQGQQIIKHFEQGGGTYSRWKAAGIGIIGLIITLAFIFGQFFLVSIFTPEMEGKKIIVNDNKNRVYYESIDSAEAANLIDTLRTLKFFDVNYDLYFKIEGKEKGYRILFPTEKDYWYSPEVLGHYAAFKSFLENRFPEKEFEFCLFQEGFSERETKEIRFEDSLPLWWMKKPEIEENEYQISKRVIAYLSFWEEFFKYGVKMEAQTMSWPVIPNVLNFASNGIALIKPDMITKEWIETFFNEEAAEKAYNLLRQSFTKITWPANAVIYKSHLGALSSMKRNIEIIKNQLQNLEEAAQGAENI